MNEKEEIDVYIKYENGRTVCICIRSGKRCKCRTCESEVVERDKFQGWEDMFNQDRYGKSRDDNNVRRKRQEERHGKHRSRKGHMHTD